MSGKHIASAIVGLSILQVHSFFLLRDGSSTVTLSDNPPGG